MSLFLFRRSSQQRQPNNSANELPPSYEISNDNNLEYQQELLEKKKQKLDQIKQEIQKTEEDIFTTKLMLSAKQADLQQIINEIKSISKLKAEKMVESQKNINNQILKMMEKENERFKQEFERLKADQIKLFDAKQWLEEHKETVMNYIENPVISIPSKEIETMYQSKITKIPPNEKWSDLSDSSKSIWNDRAINYMEHYGESMTGKILYERCQKSGYSYIHHHNPKILKDKTVIPCYCIRCLWTN